jgi:CubicO group peptidase (beta-lactamase class C family)
MSNTPHKRKSSLFRKFFRATLIFLFLIILAGNLFILISGRTYLYKGLKETYLRGKSGPGIYDSVVFQNRRAEKAKTPSSWKFAEDQVTLNQDEKDFLSKIRTTSFLVVKEGEVIHESYFGNHKENTKSNTFSAAKSFVGLMIGIAIDKGYINSFDDQITEYLDFSIPNDSLVTIRHLLTMSSGLNWVESGGNPLSDNAEAYYGSDLPEIMSETSFGGEPGKEFVYKSGNSQLLGIILENATGMTATEFLEKQVWSKINTEADLLWSLDHEDGMEKSFCCIYGTSRDFAKIGQLILNEGMWNGKQIISKNSLSSLLQPINKKERFYGMHFWRYEDPENPVFYARGILGQYIIVIPSLNTVVVRTGHERLDKYKIPESKKDNSTFIDKNQHKVMHPLDLFQYISTAKRMVK